MNTIAKINTKQIVRGTVFWMQFVLLLCSFNSAVMAGEVFVKPDLFISSENKIFGYTLSGQKLSEIEVDTTNYRSSTRDIISLKDGRVAVINENPFTSPKLSIYYPRKKNGFTLLILIGILGAMDNMVLSQPTTTLFMFQISLVARMESLDLALAIILAYVFSIRAILI